MRVLVVCPQSPWPATAGSALRSWHWLTTAARVAELGVIALCRSADEAEEAARALRSVAVWTRVITSRRTRARQIRDTVRSRVLGTPRLVETAREPALAAALHDALAEFRPDLVQGEQIASAPLLAIAAAAGLPTLYSAHNVESRALASGAAARRMARFEQEVCRAATGVVGVSEVERRWLAPHARRIAVVPNAVDVAAYPYPPGAARDRRRVVFVGHLAYPPNREAARVLAEQLLPRLRQVRPDIELTLAGREPAHDVRRLARLPGVRVVASFRDVREILASASVFLAPLSRGAGSRVKLLEAAACGVPIVCSRFAAEGLALEPGTSFLAAETPAEMADAALRLLTEPSLADELARAARESVQHHHDWHTMAPLLAALYDASLADHHRS